MAVWMGLVVNSTVELVLLAVNLTLEHCCRINLGSLG